MSKQTPDELICESGRCACGARIIRGLDNTRQLVTADIWAADATSELIAWASSRASFVLDLTEPRGRGLTLTRRTARQIRRRPAGFKRERIVLAHECKRGDQ